MFEEIDARKEETTFKRRASRVRPMTIPSSPINKAGNISLERYASIIERHADYSGNLIGSDMPRAPLQYIDPLFDPILLMFPKENLKELYRRLRHYYSYHPIVRNIIDLNSTFPFSDMEIRCDSKVLESYWQDWADRVDLQRIGTEAQHDRELLGEDYHIANWDIDSMEWSEFRQVPPEAIDAHAIYAGEGVAYFLKPDEELRKLMGSNKEVDQALTAMLPSDLRESIQQGKPYFLENSRVIHYANKPAGYILHGDSSMKAALRYLLLEDKMYMLLLTFCFPGTEQVVMADGTVKLIKDVQIGDRVVSHTGKIRPVTFKHAHKYSGRMINLKIGGLQTPITSTENHPFLVKSNSSSEWKQAKDLKKGDILLRPRNYDLGVPDTLFTEGKGRLLGYYLAEGSLKTYWRKNKIPSGVRFTFNVDELSSWVPDVQRLLKAEFNVDSYVNKNGKNAVNVITKGINPSLADWFITHGAVGSHNKRLSAIALGQPINVLKNILIGALRGDAGWKHGRVVYTSVSESLTVQISHILDKLGFSHNQLDYIKSCNNRKCHQLTLTVKSSYDLMPDLDPSIDLSARTQQLRHCQDIVDFVFDKYAQGLNRTEIAKELSSAGFKTWHGKEFYVGSVSRILKSKKYGKTEGTQRPETYKNIGSEYIEHEILDITDTQVTDLSVYNLEVEEEHSYLVRNGIATHNCDRTMFPVKIWKLGSENAKWMPPKAHFDRLREEILKIKNDPDADILYHAFLKLDVVSLADKHEDLLKYFEWTQKRILIALAASEAMFTEANPYAKDSMSIKLIMHRYMRQRAQWNRIMQQRMCLPIAKKRGFVKRQSAEIKSNIEEDNFSLPVIDRYHIPKFFWRPSNLISNAAEKEFLAKLRDKGDLDIETLHDHCGLDSEKIAKRLTAEAGTGYDPVFREARKELVKDPITRNQILRGVVTKDLELPVTPPGGKGSAQAPAGGLGDLLGMPPAGPGRPAKAPGDKAKKEPAIIPPNVMSAREKLNEKEQLPAPKGEGEPLI